MQEMLPNFCVFHVNAPGQEYGAAKLPEDFGYPAMDDLAEQVSEVPRQDSESENTHLLHKGKYHGTVYLLFGLNQTCKSRSNATSAKQLNPHQSNWR